VELLIHFLKPLLACCGVGAGRERPGMLVGSSWGKGEPRMGRDRKRMAKAVVLCIENFILGLGL
jgi:hypothetical protein